MSKNQFMNKGNKPEVKNPVEEAQAEQMATYQPTEEAPIEKVVAPEVVVTTNQEVPANPVEKEPEAPKAEPVVQEVTKSREITQSNLIRNNRPSAAQGQVLRPSGAATREVSPPAKDGKDHVVSNEFRARMDTELKSGTVNAISLISFLDTYVKVMAPRKITSTQEILRMQEGLLDNLSILINRAPAKEFSRLWNIATQYVSEYIDACFSPMYFSRGARDWKRDPQQFQLLSSLINLLLATARDKKSVTEVVNLETVVGHGFSEEARGRIFNFYS